MFKLDLEKAEEPEIKFPTSVGSWKKQESSRKTSTSALLYQSSIYHLSIHLSCIYRPPMFMREGFTIGSWLTQSWRLAARTPVDEGRPRGADGEAAGPSQKA